MGFDNPHFKNLARGKKLILLGDDHNTSSGIEWLKEELPIISGEINFLATEYIESDKGNLLTNKDTGEILEYLKNRYKDFPGFNPNSIVSLLRQAQKLGMHIAGVDMPEDTFTDWTILESQMERTKHLSRKILELAFKHKGVVLLGADHVEKKSDNVYGLLKAKGLDPISIVFIGGKDWTIDTEEYWIRKEELLAKQNKFDRKLFYYKSRERSLPCDWVIHFPQI